MAQGMVRIPFAVDSNFEVPPPQIDYAGTSAPKIEYLGEVGPVPQQAPSIKANTGIGGDSWTDIKRGVQQLPGTVTGLLDIPFAYAVGARPMSEGWGSIGRATGFQPGKWAKDAEAEYTPERKAQMDAVSKAWDDAGGSELSRVIFDPSRWNELPTQWDRTDAAAVFKAINDNPRATWGTVLQSLPSTVAGGVASGVARTLAKIPASVAAGLGEGAVTAGQAMDQIDPKVSGPRAATAALMSGAITGVIGGVSGKVSSKLGIPDIEMPMPKTGKPYPFYTRVPIGMVKEGVLEEGLQSPQEQVWQNWAERKPLGEGALRAGVEGPIAGAALGGAYALRRPKPDVDQSDNAIPAADVGAGPGGSGGGISGEYIPAAPVDSGRRLADQAPTGNTYDQGRPELPAGQTLLPLPMLPAPEDGGPSERQVATARGLLNHSPNASPELLQRLMRVDQGMATMLFNHWQGLKNGEVAGNQGAQVPAEGSQGQGADNAGSGILDGQRDGAVSPALGQPSSAVASGGEPGMVVGTTDHGTDTITPLEVQAHGAATSPFNARPQPTEAQKQAGNYAKGHVRFQGMDISIENPAGSVRSGKDEDGKAWENTLQHHYGYIKGTVGRDKDHLDVFIKPGAQSARTAYVIDQINPKTGRFDEHKVVLGADSEADARAIYQANYAEGWNGLGEITAMPIATFKGWIKSGKTKKPIAYVEPKEVRTATRTSKTASTLLQAIVNRGGINRSIMADVGGDPGARYMPGLFTNNGTTDLSTLAGDLFGEDGFHQIHQDSPIGPARELEDLIARAINGERILSTAAMEKGMQAEENAKLKEKAQRLGVKTVARKIEDIAADVARAEAQSILDEETRLEDDALLAYNELVDALNAAIGERDAEGFIEELASRYQDDSHLTYLRNAITALKEKLNAEVQSAGKPEEPAAGPAETGNATGGAQGGADALREAAQAAPTLSSYSEKDLADRDAANKAAEAQRLREEQDAENKRQADAERGSFQLTGSTRPADVLAAQGQGGLFDQPTNSEKQPAAPVAESLAPEPSEPGDAGVSTGQGGAAAGYVPPSSVEDARRRWSSESYGAPNPERGPGHVALMDAVRKALNAKLFYNRDVTDFAAKELGVASEQRKVGTSEDPKATKLRDTVEGGAFGYDVYLARKEVEKEQDKQANAAAAERMNLAVGMNIGKVKTSDGKIASAATVKSLSPSGVVLTAKRGPQTIKVTTSYAALEAITERAGNDFFKKREAFSNAIAGKPLADMPAEQLQKIASGESKTFGAAAVEKASAELARRDEVGSPKSVKEPWQYGELEYGDKYIDEVVLPDLRKKLANAHGGKFQEYPSKAAAVRDLMDDFSIGRGISYAMGGRDAYANAVRAQVERTTDADLAEYAEHVKSIPVNTGVNARMVVIEKPGSDGIELAPDMRAELDAAIAERSGTKAMESRSSYGALLDSVDGLSSENGLPNKPPVDRTLDAATLRDLRREAAGLESPERGTFLTVTEDGRAVATGQKGTRVPETFARFAEKHGLTFDARRIAPGQRGSSQGVGKPIGDTSVGSVPGEISSMSPAMPIEYRESGAMYFGESGAFIDRTGKTRFSIGKNTATTGQTESTRAIQSIVDKFLQQFAGAAALNIRVVRTVADIPARFRPSPFAEGVFHDDAGLIYLVAMNLKHANGQVNTGRVWQVLLHECIGHFGLAKMMGSRFGGILKEVMRAARAKGEVGEDIYEPGHPDYATVEAVRLRYTTASDKEVAQEVLARMAETDPGRTLFGYVRAVVRQWLRDMARAAGITLDVTTAELNDLVAQASRYMRRGDGVAQGVDVDALGVADMAVGGMASKATGMESRAAPTAGQPKEPRTGFLDTILRKAGGELAAKITGPAYDKLTAYLGGKVPEGIKAGMVSDYGLDESYIDRRTGMQTEQQKAARQTKTFVEGLMDLDRAQSRVAYQWLNNRGAEADRLMAQLPPESQQVLKDIKAQIAKLTIEAVRLGQLDAETAVRNWGAYLHRSYAKYDLKTDDKVWKAERAKAIKILGDQYKGRGLKMDVDPDRIHSAPGWWEGEMKGKRVKVLKNDAGRFAFVAEGTAIPPNLSGYKVEGVWEIRARKAADRITLWRDFTQDERTMMGELDEAKYAVARTLFMMNRDIEVGRFHEWVADEYAKTPEEAEEEGLQMADASDSMMRAFTPDEWVTVPTSKIPGTGVFKYGALAGMVVPGPVWNDIRQISAGRFEPFGAAYASILRAWKLSKTALTPTTHVNNIMGNFVMADMHDVGARDAIAAVRLMVAAANGDKDAKAMLDRFEDSGATQGMFTTHELKKEVLEPLLQQLREEVGMADDEAAILKVSAIMSLALHGQFGEAWAGAKAAAKQSTAGRVTGAVVTKAQDYYQAEDSVFRLAAFLKSIDEGKTDLEAGKLSRKAFLDYHINAPWINAMRGTAMPFIAFAYRAIPMLVETAARKPWKIAKYMLVAGGLNALAYAMLGADADEDKERAYLPDEKAGRLWGIVPKLIRMPWNRESKLRDGRTTSDPVFLDVRRWLPVGDVVDYGQDKTALPLLPQPLIPGGPAVIAFEYLVNKSAFTGKDLTKETDTWVEKAAKVGGHFYKGFAPNVPIPYSGTWAGTKIDNAIKGKEDPLGRAYPVPEAIASGFGLKLERYPVDTLKRNAALDMKGKLRELDAEKKQAARDYGRNGMQKVELDEKISDVVTKKNKVVEEYRAKERKAMGR